MKRVYDLNAIKLLAKSRKGEFLSKEYTVLKKHYQWSCSEGHIFEKTAEDVRYGQWCKECSDGLYERICRATFEALFETKFPKKRNIHWLKNKEGRFLELDGFNKNLNIAFEHQGTQHYGDDKFFSLSKYDSLKRELCKKNRVRLIEVPELVTRLKIKDLIPYLEGRFKKLGIANYKKLTLEEIDFSGAYGPDWIKEISELAKPFNGKLLTKNYFGAQWEYEWQCHRKHTWKATKYTVHNWCPYCRYEVKVRGRYYKNFEAACEKFKVSVDSARRRVRVFGESPEEAINFLSNKIFYNVLGKRFKTKKSACDYFNILPKSLDNYARKHQLGFEEAVEKFIASKHFVFEKEFKSAKAAAHFYNINEEYLYRIKVDNSLTTEEAVIKILNNRSSRKVEYKDKTYDTFIDLCNDLNLSRSALKKQIERNNLTLEQAIEKLLIKQSKKT